MQLKLLQRGVFLYVFRTSLCGFDRACFVSLDRRFILEDKILRKKTIYVSLFAVDEALMDLSAQTLFSGWKYINKC